MPHPTFWTCSSCSRTLGQVRRDGTLEVSAGGRVIVPAATEADVVIVVICPACASPRRWSPRPPGFEVKAGYHLCSVG